MSDLTERQKHLIENPEWSLVTCLNTLFNSMRLVQAARKGLLDPGLFSKDFTLVNEDDPSTGIQVRAAEKPIPADLILENIMKNVAATCFMQFDELASQKLGRGNRFSHKDSDIRNTCMILYLVRCAFAHNPLTPTWLIKPHFQNKVFEIPAIELRLDTTGLHRKIDVVPRIGGWVGASRLLQHAHKLISPETSTLMELKQTG